MSYDIANEATAVSVTDEATFSDIDAPVTVTMTTQVYSLLSSSSNNNYTDGRNDNASSSSVSVADELTSSVTMAMLGTAVILKTYDTTYDLYFDTLVAIIVAVASVVAVGAPSVVMTCNTAVPVITKISFANFVEDASADAVTWITTLSTTLLSFHETLYLLLITFCGTNTLNCSIFIFDTIILLMHIHNEYLYITGVCCRTKMGSIP